MLKTILSAPAFPLIVIALSACAEGPRLVPIRMDGQSIGSNPVLQQAFETDRTVCVGEARKASLSGTTFASGGIAGAIAQAERDDAVRDVMAGCMAQKGYKMVPHSVAAHELDRYRANSQAAAGQGSQIVTSSTVQPQK